MSSARRIWRLLNASCHDVSRLASESFDRELVGLERFALRSHTVYCAACRRYERQLRFVRAALCRLATETALAQSLGGPALPDEAREQIKRAVEDAETF
jgi:hypothetical protein